MIVIDPERDIPFDISFEGSGDVKVTKNTDEETGEETYEIGVYDGANIEIGIQDDSGKTNTVGMEFTLPKSAASYANTKAKITLNATTGKIESVKTVLFNENTFTEVDADPIGGTSIKITGATEDVVAKDFTVDNVLVKVESGNFDYSVVGKKGDTENVAKEIKLTDENAVLLAPIVDTSVEAGSVEAEVKITAEKEVTYDGETYNLSEGQFMYTPDSDATAGSKPVVLVFGKEDSSFTISEEKSAVTILKYIDTGADNYNKYDTSAAQVEVTPLPIITSDAADKSSRIYTVAMTTLATRGNHGKA